MAKIWMQGKERFMCPVCENEEIELGQKYCQICGEPLEWVEDKQNHFAEAGKKAGKDINVLTKWIPVEERLPEDGTYLCTLDGELCGLDEPFTGMCGIENGKWDEEGCVIAWMPLPEPYQGKKENQV